MNKHKLVCSLVISLVFIFTAFNIGLAASISGTISYDGSQSGAIYAAAFTSPINCDPPSPGEPFAYTELTSLGSYTIPDLPDGTYYMVSVIQPVLDYMSATDPWAVYGGCGTATPVIIIGGSNISGINLSLVDGTLANPNPFYKKYEINLSSHHYLSGDFIPGYIEPGYYAYIQVEDFGQNADSVAVSGPGITEFMNLVYNNAEGRWESSFRPFIGSSVPASPQIYTFTIDGSPIIERAITGYVEDFATNLFPTGIVEGPITFTWSGISNADGYGISLNDEYGNRIWQNYDIPGSTTSIIYDGPDLTPNVIYNYSLFSVITTDDVSNLSFSPEASFTYGPLGPPQGSLLASVPAGASFDFSTGFIDSSDLYSPGLSGDFICGNSMSGLTASPNGISGWVGVRRLYDFMDWIADPSYLPPPSRWHPASSSTERMTRFIKTTEGKYAMIFSLNMPGEQCDFYYVYPYGNFTWSDTEAPLPPTLLSVTDTGLGGSLLIHWQVSPSSDVAGYNIYSSINTLSWSIRNAGNTNYYLLTNLTNGLLYHIKVSAYDYEGNRIYFSEVLSATPTFTGDPDSDFDAISDGVDNCPSSFNPDQIDTDNDNVGNACDLCPYVADDQSDSDSDGVGDACDVCPDLADDQSDLDNDGLGDACDNDADGDGVPNSEEIQCNSNPLDSTSKCIKSLPWLTILLLDDDPKENKDDDFKLIGGWFYNPGTLAESGVLTIFDDTNYMFVVDGEPDVGGGRGMERGTYTWDSSSGAFTATAISKTLGDWGVSSLGEMTVSVNENILNVTDSAEGPFSFTKILSATNSIVGSWFFNPGSLADSAVLTFIDDTNYMFAVDGNPDDGGGRGMERGTYTWNQSSSAFNATAISGTAGDWGVSYLTDPTVSIVGNTITIIDSIDGPISLTKVE